MSAEQQDAVASSSQAPIAKSSRREKRSSHTVRGLPRLNTVSSRRKPSKQRVRSRQSCPIKFGCAPHTFVASEASKTSCSGSLQACSLAVQAAGSCEARTPQICPADKGPAGNSSLDYCPACESGSSQQKASAAHRVVVSSCGDPAGWQRCLWRASNPTDNRDCACNCQA